MAVLFSMLSALLRWPLAQHKPVFLDFFQMLVVMAFNNFLATTWLATAGVTPVIRITESIMTRIFVWIFICLPSS